MIIRNKISILAPLAHVWQTFSDLEHWHAWNRVCRNCHYVKGEAMAPDACFSFEIAPVIFPLRIKPRIVRCLPPREVVWVGGRWGVKARHGYFFSQNQYRVDVLSVEEFRGPLLPLVRCIGLPRRLHRLTDAFLASLKVHVEPKQRSLTPVACRRVSERI